MTATLEDIEKRNARVETDKAWETSWTRRIIIALFTYLIIGGYLSYLNVEDAWRHAVVPALAYILSTLGLHYMKSIWVKNCDKNQKEAS